MKGKKKIGAGCTPLNFNERMHVLKNKALLQLYNNHQEDQQEKC
jgi:hypothetical protein